VSGLSDLINLSRRSAIWRLERMKLNCSQQNSIICILLVLKSFTRNRFATKSREEFLKFSLKGAISPQSHNFQVVLMGLRIIGLQVWVTFFDLAKLPSIRGRANGVPTQNLLYATSRFECRSP